MNKRVEIENLLFWLCKGLLIVGAGLVLLLVVACFAFPEYMKPLFIAAMFCFGLSTLLALVNTFLHNNKNIN